MPTPMSARLRRALPRPNQRRLAGGLLALAVVAGVVTWALWPESVPYTTAEQRISVLSGPDGDQPVDLDTTFYLPKSASATDPVPSVLLAHGFGGSKQTIAADAEELAALGYAVLAYTARGFGASGGQIHLNNPDYEVRDAQRLLDWLAQRPEVRTDAAGDPQVGVVGGSYGGALALLLAAQDDRVDAIVPMITWNDLARSFLPEASGADTVDGVFKKGWAGLFFGSGAVPAGLPAGAAGMPDGAAGMPVDLAGLDPACGRFAADVCAAYLQIATDGRGTPEAVALLDQSSPDRVLDQITAPTLLVQGGADTLFPLAEADANARGIAANGTPVRVAWYTGGHDGGAGPLTDQDRVKFLTAGWLDHYVAGNGDAPDDSFTWSRIAGFDAMDRGLVATGYRITDYPGTGGTGTTRVTVGGPAQPVVNPPAGNPAAISSLPIGGGLAGLAGGFVQDLPGQHGHFDSAPLADPLDVVGAPTVTIRAASPTGEAVLFVKLYDVDPNGTMNLPGGLVAPVRLTGLPADIADATGVEVTLPAIVHRFEAGNLLRVVVATSDQAYATPAEPTVYTVAVGTGGTADTAPVTLPQVAGEPIATSAALWRWVLAGLIAAIAIGLIVVLAVVRLRHRRVEHTVDAEHAQTPLVVRNLRKEYADGFVAVQRVDFTVERGQVVGLLGPNGAGKTTTLRVLMGLTQPTTGEILVFGHRLVPGSPVLSRIGSLVEGPGFLPHLSGIDNLRAYWRATGRPAADAHFDEALETAGLGDSVHRKIRNYSHGMRQRLAIAQAMLGLPELLVLDEPTDGLDPPQIAEMRRVLRRYATGGRAVLVSSHLLAEVEQTCTHAVVVNKGRIVAAGPVDDIVGDSPSVQFDVSDVAAAEAVLDRLPGVRTVGAEGAGLIVDVNGTARSEVVAELVRAGVAVDRVVPRRRLEDAFLALVGENSRGSGDR
ncbi:alpha/beta fold hydrolase [Micromonospora sp. NBC_01813]|uniref:alpha/beta fold hydrolase n=1 Tax=Micromonospora sp. NBC_01813 TaxID=2975988 RepID=UPI002DD99E6F|nr:alpha/beta fold hydrolase [Micromonospora sp. NBC_01813]WSA06577.1 alpha/beta fold hydrolase [Micromonospora sp. NBC_01813]